MTIDIVPILLLVWLHFFADFILQSDKVATTKSKNDYVLWYHVSLYSLPFIPFAFWYIPYKYAMMWLSINLVAHFVTDWITSRLTSKLYKMEKRHWFFVTIGADQAIHMTTLFATFAWLA